MADRAYESEPPARAQLEAREHVAYDGIPYYDQELGVPQTTAHRIAAVESSAVLSDIAKDAGLAFLSDEPIWYWHPENDEQRAFYGDCVIGRPADTKRITAQDLLLVMEVVSVNDRRKEFKDTRFQRLLNEYNGVPEFALLFPEVGDARALIWCQLIDGEYQEHAVAPGGSVASRKVSGLELRVLPREAWKPGYKVDFYFRGELRPRLSAERARAEQEKARAEQEKARAERLAARLRELGVDPSGL